MVGFGAHGGGEFYVFEKYLQKPINTVYKIPLLKANKYCSYNIPF